MNDKYDREFQFRMVVFVFSLFDIARELISGTVFFQLFIGILHMSATYFEMDLVSGWIRSKWLSLTEIQNCDFPI